VAARSAGEQLALAIEPAEKTTALPRLRPRRPIAGDAPFDDDEWFFEPWWPGTPTLVYVQDGRLQLEVEHLADARAAFAELSGLAGQFSSDRLIVEATLLVLDEEGRPDAELLRGRLVQPDRRDGTAALVCTDLLHRGERSLLGLPFAERRALLGRELRDGDQCVISRGLRGEGTTLAAAVAAMGLTEISARQLTARYRPAAADDAWLRLPVQQAPATSTRPLLALLQRLPL
jgi:bifunctional non-homologous end joining protein LigD